MLFVNSVYGVGSTGKIVRDLCRGLIQRGDEVKVCYGRGSNTKDDYTVKICSKVEFYSDALLTRLTGIHGYFSNVATNHLIKEIEDFSPDIVHLHNIHGYYVNIFRLVNYLKKKKIKVVWTLHDELMFTGKCSYAYECNKWETGCLKCPQINEYPKSLLFDRSKSLYVHKKNVFRDINNFCFVTPSQWLAKRVKKSILSDAECRVINNGIDTVNTFCVQSKRNEKIDEKFNHKKVILTVTDDVYSERKGLDCFIELARKSDDHSEIYVVVGGERNDVKMENLYFVSRTENQAELAAYYSRADVFVITSRCDNFPTVCIEALACGTPVVGFNVGGVAETAPQSDIGKFVELNSVSKLQDAIRYFLQCDKETVKKKCRNYASIHYSTSAMVNEYCDLYRKISMNGGKNE